MLDDFNKALEKRGLPKRPQWRHPVVSTCKGLLELVTTESSSS